MTVLIIACVHTVLTYPWRDCYETLIIMVIWGGDGGISQVDRKSRNFFGNPIEDPLLVYANDHVSVCCSHAFCIGLHTPCRRMHIHHVLQIK